MTVEQDIQRISSRIELMSNHYFETRDMLLADGEIDDVEQAILDDLANQLNAARTRVDTMIAQQTGAAIPGSDDAAAEGGAATGPDDCRPFAPDKRVFRLQIGQWRGTLRESLSDMVGNMSDTGSDDLEFPRGAIISLLAAALEATQPTFSKALGIASSLLDVAQAAFAASLSESSPSLRQIKTKWRDAIDEVSDAVADAKFDELVALFHTEKNMACDEGFLSSAYYTEWEALLDGFRGGHILPSSDDINRAFMTYIMSRMPDSPSDGNNNVGDVSINMEFDTDRNTFSFSSGAIGDITPQVRSGLNTDPGMFGSDCVTSLPSTIRIIISGSGLLDGKITEIYRVSVTSGDTNFRMLPQPSSSLSVQEQEAIVHKFIDQRIYNTIKISDIV